MFPRLFSSIRIGRYILRNRIVNAGHAAHFQTGDGLPTARYVEYVRERARGGAGLVIIGHTVPHYDGDVSLALTNYDDRVIPCIAPSPMRPTSTTCRSSSSSGTGAGGRSTASRSWGAPCWRRRLCRPPSFPPPSLCPMP